MVGTRANPTATPPPMDNDNHNENPPQGEPPRQEEPPVDPGDPPVPDLDDNTRGALAVLGQVVGDAIARAMANVNMRTPAPDPAKYPKAKDPSTFNGKNRKALRTWIGENEICFRTSPNLYRTGTAKVMFAGSFLDDYAKTWFTDYFKDPARIPAFMDDWELFTIELQRNFGLEDEVGAAEEELRKLNMADRDHATHFTARFRAITSNLTDIWDDRNLRNAYYAKIAPRLRSQFVTSGTPVPATLEPLITKVERFDRVYWSDVELNKTVNAMSTSATTSRDRNKSPGGGAQVPQKNSQPAKTGDSNKTTGDSKKAKKSNTKSDSHLTDDNHLTEAERQRRLTAGVCLYCGEDGHFARDCQKKTSSSTSAKAAAGTTPSPAADASAKPSARASITVNSDSDESGKE